MKTLDYLVNPRSVFVLMFILDLGSVTARARAAGEDNAPPAPLGDKTLVAWVSPANLSQRGGSVLTIEDPPGQFDGIVLGELRPGCWMAGSDFFRRTERDQAAYPAETARSGETVQIAIVYRGKDVTIYRDGERYASYSMATEPAQFSPRGIVLLGLRHLDAGPPRLFFGDIEDARIYAGALDRETIGALEPDEPSDPPPLGWWSFEEGSPRDRSGNFPDGHLVGQAEISNGRLRLSGGYLIVGIDPPRDRASEDWPTYHVSALPDEGLCRPYDANGCIHWKGRYHLMYIFQDPSHGHSWGHLSSPDLLSWTYHPPALVPQPGDPDRGIFSGNAFVNKEGVPMLCWFGIDAGVCVATAQDDHLVEWKKHPRNPIIPIPKPGDPEHGLYRVWDPYLWLEGDTYYCLLGGNQHPDGEDTLFLCKSGDLVSWTPLHPFYRAEPSWTVPGEDCSCPDFFALGDRHVLLCISHKVGARCYIGRYENERFYPERHLRMNWPGGNFFAPESLVDDRGRRIIWAWVTDPRLITTQRSTGSGVQSLPRVLELADDGGLRIRPAEELRGLRRNPRRLGPIPLAADSEKVLEAVRGETLELAIRIDPGSATEVGVKVRCSPDGTEETGIWYEPGAEKLKIDMSRSTLRQDVVYTQGPLDSGGMRRAADNKNPRSAVEAPLRLAGAEPLDLRVFLDGPMLEVFANDRQCVTQQIFPRSLDSQLVKVAARGGPATVRSLEAWDMAPATFVDRRRPEGNGPEVLFEDGFDGDLASGWRWLRENPETWRLRDGALEIQLEPGAAHDVRNALVRQAPDRSKGTFVIELRLTSLSEPTEQYEQAGITWYRDGKPVFKLVKERVDGQLMMIPGRKPMESETVELQLTVTADAFTARYRPEGRGEFLIAAQGRLPPPGRDEVSIQGYHGPPDAEHWVRFDDFRILRPGE